MKKKCNVIGVFPPPYGGATVKCKLFNEILQNNGYCTYIIDIYEINRKKQKVFPIFFECIKAFCSKEPIIYCLDSKRLNVITLLQNLFAFSFPRTTVVAVGGAFNEVLLELPSLKERLKRVGNIWVETEGLKEQLRNMGFKNIEFFPNPKSEQGSCRPQMSDPREPLKILYFSQISREKGVGDIIDLVELLEKDKTVSFEMDFYGHVEENFDLEFQKFLRRSKNVKYCGIYDSTKQDLYSKLNEYDVLLFPTHWNTEGVPGILVEAKMAGLAIIASDRSYNSEIVRTEKMEGILLYQDYVKEMFEAIKKLSAERGYLMEIKEASYQSRERYAMSSFEEIVKKI